MGGDRAAVDRSRALERVRRFAALRAAQRAVAPAVRFPEPLLQAEQGRELRGLLEELTARSQATEAGEDDAGELLARVDGALLRFGEGLLAAVDRLAFAEIRAALPEVTDANRLEVTALLDLCLSSPEELTRRLSLIEFLVTRLASELRGGIRRLVREPNEVSPGMKELCARADEAARPAYGEAARIFREAAAEVTARDEIDSVVQRVRSAKTTYADCFFASEVLASIVAYNLAAANRIQILLAADRTQDPVLPPFPDEDQVEPPPRPRAARPPRTAPPRPAPARLPAPALPAEPPPPAVPSALEAPGVLAVAEAIRTRLAGRRPQPGAPAEFAARLEPGALREWVRNAFLAPVGNESQALARAVVAVGAIAEALAERPDLLAAQEIEVDFATLNDHWLPELEARIRELTGTLVAGNGYEEARHLSDVKSQFLSALTVARVRAREATPLARRPRAAPAPRDEAESLRGAVRGFQRAVAAAPRAREATGSEPERARRPRLRPRLLALAAVAASLLLAVPYLLLELRPGPGSVRVLAAPELGELSPHLASGYRDRRASGSLFIGTLTGDWARLAEEQRLAAARTIRERLAEEGVWEVMLFDGRHRLQVHLTGEELQLLAPPAR